MPITVVSFAAYLTTDDIPWRDADYCASSFVKAIKPKPFGGYHRIPVCSKSHKLTMENSDDAIQWFGEMAAEYMQDKFSRSVLVPIPNSPCTVKSKVIPRTRILAESIASRVDRVTVWDGLRWKREMTPSSKGGTRDPHELFKNLVVTDELPDRKLILIDDVRTKGAHLIAAKARLVEKGGDCRFAICAGRTVLTQETNPFAVVEEQLDDLAIDSNH
jgi:hypothetical protein